MSLLCTVQAWRAEHYQDDTRYVAATSLISIVLSFSEKVIRSMNVSGTSRVSRVEAIH